MRAPAGFPTGLALARARHALAEAGLDPEVPLERASSVTNEVWLGSDVVVRVNRRPDRRLAREARLGASLPDAVRYPEVVGFGTNSGFDWLVSRRRPGSPLSRAWPRLPETDRRDAVRQLAEMIRLLHLATSPPDVEAVAGPQLLRDGARTGDDAVEPLLAALTKLRLTSVADFVRSAAPKLGPCLASTLIHGDLTFENVLWHDGEITALIDFEYSRPAAADLDLDVLLRFCAYPELHVAADYAQQTQGEDYEAVPWWLIEDYPELVAFDHQIDRLRVYAIAFDVRELLQYPEGSARRRLDRTLHGRSHVDSFAGVLTARDESLAHPGREDQRCEEHLPSRPPAFRG